jgi:hypothetical protein
MALRDVIKIGSRVLGAGIGLVGTGFNPMGAITGYGLGATAGDLVAGQPKEVTNKAKFITGFRDEMSSQKAPTSRVSEYDVTTTDLGISDKITAVTDPMVSMASSLYGIAGRPQTTMGDRVGDINKKFKRNFKTLPTRSGINTADISGITDTLGETDDKVSSMIDMINSNVSRQGLPTIRNTRYGGNIAYIGSSY